MALLFQQRGSTVSHSGSHALTEHMPCAKTSNSACAGCVHKAEQGVFAGTVPGFQPVM